ncbi:hypothetical protein EYZ11_009233 [Aspergillus tanneri]|uniref:Uncharacterized protein n=1 Tax=Aspergillus tanneri TaxID=1220188 RepID=A0A4S3J8F2_9EURO|nr:hypothetical protein EYZ11_009233 [Aspergillus tanneri]
MPYDGATRIETRKSHEEGEEHRQREGKEKEKVLLQGFYIDGVYTVPAPTSVDVTATGAHIATGTYSDAQSSYYNLLRHRFLLLRSILKCTPPSTAIAALDDSHPISLPRHSKIACKEWRRLLLAVDPQTVQLACMDMESVLGVLGIMARLMSENVRSGDAARIRRIGAWAWGLLSKCREVGQLGTEEVGEIRELGKRAVKILRKMKEEEDEKNNRVGDEDGEGVSNEESDNEDHPVDDSGHADDEEGENRLKFSNDSPMETPDQDMPDAEREPPADELEQAKAQLQAKIQDSMEEPESTTQDRALEASMQTRAMLDMIITVVGEYYGQRDLLEAREMWMGDT